MTLEEAAELILQGDIWELCPTCCGMGTMLVEGGKGTGACATCEGYCKTIEPDYVEACQLLDKPIPSPHSVVVDPTLNRIVDIDPKVDRWMRIYFQRGALGQMKTVVNPVVEAVVKLHHELPFTRPKK